MTRRTERVNELMREEISGLVLTHLNDPRIVGLVTITHVDVSPDLRHALAFVSVLGTDAERVSTMAALDHARPFLKRELSSRVRLRYLPDIEFRVDDSMERAQMVTDLDAPERERAGRGPVTGVTAVVVASRGVAS